MQQPTLAHLQQLNRELVMDITCSPEEYITKINQERGNIDHPRLLAEIELGLGRKYSNASKPTLALEHLMQGQKMLEALPKTSQDPWWVGMMHHWYGNTYVEMLDFDQALHHYFSSIKPFREGGYEWHLNNGTLKIGHVMLRMGAGDEAIKYIKSAMVNSIDYPTVVATAYYLMGVAYQAIGDFEQAGQYFDQHYEAIDNPYKIFASFINSISCYIEQGELDKAKHLLSKATALEEKRDLNSKRKTNLLLGRAKVATAEHSFQQALTLCNEALSIANETSNLLNQAKIKLQQAEILLLSEQLDESQSLLEEILNTKLSADIRGSAINLLLKIYKQTEQWEKAFSLVSGLNETALFTQSRLRSIEQLIDARQHEQALKKKNAELVALHFEKDELLRIVAHDLRNPLSAALLTIEMLKLAPSTHLPSQKQQLYDRTHSSILSAVDIITQLTAMAKAEAENTDGDLETVAVHDLITTVVAENVPLAQIKQQTLVVGQLTPVSIEANQLWIKQILSNLISNAIKYSSPGSTTTVTLKNNPSEKKATIEVEDEGLGLSEEDMHHVFTKYKRLSAKPTGDEPSTGLGLYITKVLSEKLGGTISVTSEGKDKGSTFIVTFPI